MTDEEKIERIRELYGMEPLGTEGGLYKQTYLSDEILSAEMIPGRDGDHPLYTVILYLLKGKGFSRMHRLPSDEIFHFYMGDPVDMLQLYPDGTGRIIRMGNGLNEGEHLQIRVPRGTWQGTRLAEGSKWALLGTTMAPGYLDIDYEDGNKEQLQKEYPQFHDLLESYAAEGVTE